MPARHSLHVALPEPLVAFVRRMVADGHHPNASQVVQAGLLHLIERDEAERANAAKGMQVSRG